jgi:hypothetical protein
MDLELLSTKRLSEGLITGLIQHVSRDIIYGLVTSNLPRVGANDPATLPAPSTPCCGESLALNDFTGHVPLSKVIVKVTVHRYYC